MTRRAGFCVVAALVVFGGCSSRQKAQHDASGNIGGPDGGVDGPGSETASGGAGGGGGAGGSATGIAGSSGGAGASSAGTTGTAGGSGTTGAAGAQGSAGAGGTAGNTSTGRGGAAGGGSAAGSNGTAGSSGTTGGAGTTGSAGTNGGEAPTLVRYPGPVSALLATNGIVYATGGFNSLGPPFRLAAIDTTTGGVRSGPARITGAASASVADGSGGFYVAGANVTVDDDRTARDYLAHVLADGSVDAAFKPPAGRVVKALALSGGVLYVAGSLGVSPDQVAALDARTGAALSFTPPYLWPDKGTISVIAAAGNTLYIAGQFQTIGDDARNRFAALDATTGALLPQTVFLDGPVEVMAASDSTIYLGGTFTRVGSAVRTGAAALDAATGATTAWDPNVGFNTNEYFTGISAIAVRGATTYLVGRNVVRVGTTGQLFDGVGAFDATTGAGLWTPSAYVPIAALTPGQPRPIRAIAADAGAVYVGGGFTSVGGIPRPGLAALNPATGALVAGFAPTSWATVDTLAAGGGMLFATGTGGPTATGGTAVFDGTTGLPVRSLPAGSNGGHTALIGDRLLLGGADIHAVDVQTGVTSWRPGHDGASLAVAASADTFFLAGNFQTVAGTARNSFAAIDATNGTLKPWAPLSATATPPTFGPTAAMAFANGVVYLAGGFTSIGAQNRAGLAAFDASTGAVTSWDPRANAGSQALVVDGDTVYVGGSFTSIAGQPRNRVAAIDRVTASALPWNPNVDGPVTAIALTANVVYLGGKFANVNGQPRDGLAAVSRTTGDLLPWSPATPFALGDVSCLAVTGSHVFAGGAGLAILEPAR